VELSTNIDAFSAIVQICLIDLLLSGDNAILIALACASLPEAVRRKAILLGTVAAVLFRVVLTFMATLALRAPYIKLLGAVLLLLIAIELLAGEGGKHAPDRRAGGDDVWRAMVLIVVADAVMSLDNVVAVAAAAQDNLLYLVLGLLISVPLLVFASLFVTRLLAHQPLLIDAGAALLGWIAGKTAVADPAVAGFLNTQSFGLVALAPVLGALYVVIQGRRLRAQRQPAGAAAAATPRAGAVAVLAAQALEQAGALAGTAQDAGMAPAQPPHAVPDAVPASPERAYALREASVAPPAPVYAAAGAPSASPGQPYAAATAILAPPEQPSAKAEGPLPPPEPPYAAVEAALVPAAGTVPAPRRFSPMDLTIMAGVAVPLLGFIATIVYLIVHAIVAH